MTTQPEALRLADDLDDEFTQGRISNHNGRKAAAELRRLHAENEALRKTLAASCDEERQQMWEAGPGGGCSRALTAEFQRDALLEALNAMLTHMGMDEDEWNRPTFDQARAAIAKVEENT